MKGIFPSAAVAAAVVAVFGLAAIPANAVTTNCPGTAITTDREFQTDTTPATTCLTFGNGNISGDPASDQFLLSNTGWMIVDTDTADNQIDNLFSVTGIGTKTGAFSFTGAVTGFKYALGLNSGTMSLNPDWAVFDLNGAISGTWSILNGSQTLARANLYKMATTTAAIPLPASLPLLLGALAGLGVISRRRRAA